MPNNLSFSGVVGVPIGVVVNALAEYVASENGSLEHIEDVAEEYQNCVVCESHGNTTIQYPRWYESWYEASMWLSERLGTQVFAFEMTEQEFWWFILLDKGNPVARFCPQPHHLGNDFNDEEDIDWSGDAHAIAHHVPYVDPQKIQEYFKQWTKSVVATGGLAYPGDEYDTGDVWQILDFMRKVNLTALDFSTVVPVHHFRLSTRRRQKPIVHEEPHGDTPKFDDSGYTNVKPWWKFWTRY